MATLITNADGNLTGAATFASIVTSAGAAALIRNVAGSMSVGSSQTSSTFTVTNGAIIDGVFLWVRTVPGATGTFKVDLHKGGVSQQSVTVNKTDLSLDATIPYPTFFKFASTATGDGGSNWTIVITNVSGGVGNALYYRNSATTADITRALRTTTAATAAAGDDLFIVGELTGAGTHNSRVVTMNSTVATVYGNGAVNSTTVNGGGVHVSSWATLTYGTTASTNYILRVNGDLIVYQNGTLNIGASGAEIPRTSTAVLEFQQASADGDFGLRILDGTFNAAGLSRTSGKNIVKCKLTADVASSSVFNVGPNTSGLTSNNGSGLDPTGYSLLAPNTPVENSSSSTHAVYYQGPSITNTTQTATVWLARGTGANNRYVRLTVGGNAALVTSVTNGFYVDVDLQAGTIGTVTALGNGTATSASITVEGRGFIIRMVGKVSSSAAAPAFFMNSCSTPGTVTYTGSGASTFIADRAALVTTPSMTDTTFNVDADTGWLAGDAIIVASTTRTASECEIYPLNANAGASSMTSALYPFGGITVQTHHGTSPVQAEIGLLTRNVKIRSTSNTLMAYVYCTALATVTVSWTEFYYLGTATTDKRGVTVDGGAVANAKSFTYCSLHDFDSFGFYCLTSSITSLNVTFSNNVMWLSYGNNFVTISGTVTNPDWTLDSNLVMLTTSSGNGFHLADIGGVCTNNTVVGVGSTGSGFLLAETSTSIGTFSSNTAHSGGDAGIETSGQMTGAINNCTVWRCNGSGVRVDNTITPELTFDNLLMFGNTSTSGNFNLVTGDAINISNSVIAGDTTFASQRGIVTAVANLVILNLANVDMSGIGSIYAPHTGNDFYLGAGTTNLQGTANNCKFGAPSLFSSRTWQPPSYYSFQKYNQTNGDHRTEMMYGQLKTDTTIYHTASPSQRLTPNSASNKLQSAIPGKGKLYPIDSGGTVTPSVWIRKDVTYFGNQPRLIVRGNSAIGITTDTVLATASDVNSTQPAIFDGTPAGAVTVTGGGLTVTHGSVSSAIGVFSLTGRTSDKSYFEITPAQLSDGNMVGLAPTPPSTSFVDPGVTLTGGVGIFTTVNNRIYVNGADTGISLGSSVGNVLCIAVDQTASLGWLRVNNGNWNGSGTANPATGVGGLTIPAGSLAPVVRYAAGSAAYAFTFNFGASSFAYAVPSGFASGWIRPTYTGTATWVQLTGTTATAIDDGAVEVIVDCDGTAGFINVDDWA